MIPNLSEKYKDKFLSRFTKGKNCWIWTHYKTASGYGAMKINNVTYRAHRISLFLYTKENKKEPVLHSCNNPSCVNPKHLRYGTLKENSQDCIKSGNNAKLKRSHCLHGHPLSGDNLRIIYPNTRKCRICARAIFYKYRKKVRAKEKLKRLNYE